MLELKQPWKLVVMARLISPVILYNPNPRQKVEDDLTTMGCLRFIRRPWNIQGKEMIEELIYGILNQYELTIRGRWKAWSPELRATVYFASSKGSGRAIQTNKYSADKLKNLANTKEGNAVGDSTNPWDQQILQFLISILYPEKPTRVTMTMANTFFGALDVWMNPMPRPVSSTGIIHSIVDKVAENLVGKKLSFVSPYLVLLCHL